MEDIKLVLQAYAEFQLEPLVDACRIVARGRSEVKG